MRTTPDHYTPELAAELHYLTRQPDSVTLPPLGQLIPLAAALGNPEPGAVHDRDDRLREVRFQARRRAAKRREEKASTPFKRSPREVTAKRPGSRRFKRLSTLLQLMDSAQ